MQQGLLTWAGISKTMSPNKSSLPTTATLPGKENPKQLGLPTAPLPSVQGRAHTSLQRASYLPGWVRCFLCLKRGHTETTPSPDRVLSGKDGVWSSLLSLGSRPDNFLRTDMACKLEEPGGECGLSFSKEGHQGPRVGCIGHARWKSVLGFRVKVT